MRRFHIAFWLLALVNAHAISAALSQEPGRATPILGMTTEDWSMQVVTNDLSYPWDINGVGNTVVMTEAGGNIVMIEGDRLSRYAVETSDPIVHDGGSGLLGMALSADFQTSGIAYLYHSYRSGSVLTNKVIQARFDGRSWRETRVLVTGMQVTGSTMANALASAQMGVCMSQRAGQKTVGCLRTSAVWRGRSCA